MIAPPQAVRRAAALVLLAMGVLSVHFLLAVPIIEKWRHSAEAVDTARDTLGRVRAIAAGAEALDAALQARRELLAHGADYLQAPSDTLAAAQIQERLKAAVETAGASLSSVNMQPSMEDGPFRRIALRAQIEARLAALQMILHELESARPMMLVETLSIRTPHSRAEDGGDPVLTIRLDVAAFSRIGEP